MSRIKYMQESLELALDSAGAFGLLTDDQIKNIAESLLGSLENESTAMGYDNIPNPLQSQIEALIASHAAEIKERDECELAYRANIADTHNIDPHRVYVKDSVVMISSR